LFTLRNLYNEYISAFTFGQREIIPVVMISGHRLSQARRCCWSQKVRKWTYRALLSSVSVVRSGQRNGLPSDNKMCCIHRL